jgi:5-methylcytosine-specific restriction endonuclease McrA
MRRGPKRPPGETRQLVEKLIVEGFSYSEIANRISSTKSTVAYHARRLGLPANNTFARRYNWVDIQAAYDSGLTMRECQERFGFCGATWTQAVNRGDILPRPRARDIEELLVISGSKNGRTNLKKRLIDAGLKPDFCEECGTKEWRGQQLSLHLHHVNGIATDNRLENLQILCPNCHSLTETWGSRNRGRVSAPSKSEHD